MKYYCHINTRSHEEWTDAPINNVINLNPRRRNNPSYIWGFLSDKYKQGRKHGSIVIENNGKETYPNLKK